MGEDQRWQVVAGKQGREQNSLARACGPPEETFPVTEALDDTFQLIVPGAQRESLEAPYGVSCRHLMVRSVVLDLDLTTSPDDGPLDALRQASREVASGCVVEPSPAQPAPLGVGTV